jgi:hypothetical protein
MAWWLSAGTGAIRHVPLRHFTRRIHQFDITKITETTSAEYQAMLSDIDIIAGYLKQLNNDKHTCAVPATS